MFQALDNSRRLLVQAQLLPVQGHRFQPTGFADIGAGTYELHDGRRMLLVESAQSVANRLDATILGPDADLIPELAGLSYVKVKLSGATDAHTSTLIEAHRINSPFIISDKAFQERFRQACGYSKGKFIDWRKVAAALYALDVNSLIHGAFLANFEDGRVRIPRALTGFIEASGVREAVSGGVKNNPLDPTGKIRAKGYDKDVYGNVPYQRVEYTAESITAFFNLDLGLIRSYALGSAATELLISLALLKVRRFLTGGLRLRTACDLRVDGQPRVTEPAGYSLPHETELMSNLQRLIAETRHLFANPPVTQITTTTVQK